MEKMLNTSFWNNTLAEWLIALGAILFTILIFNAVLKFGIKRMNRFAQKTENTYDDLLVDVLKKTSFLTKLVAGLFVGSHLLNLPKEISNGVQSALLIFILIQIALWGQVVIDDILARIIAKKGEEARSQVPMFSFMGFLGRVLLWSLVVLLALDNLGFDVTALIAGMGVGGVAIALASQRILGDLFSSLSIIFDKPFVNGDFIIVDNMSGTVEHIGLKSTRVRSLSGEQLIFSNSDLLSSRIRNFKRMNERRAVFEIGIIYETSHEKLAKIPGMIKEIIEAQENTRFDRSHFKAYGDFSLNFETVYYMLVPDYVSYMDKQQAINLALFKKFEEEGLEFAYPTKVVYNKNA